MRKKIAELINNLNPKKITPPTYHQAFVHLIQTVAEADRQKVNSVTIEAIRVVVQALQAPLAKEELPS